MNVHVQPAINPTSSGKPFEAMLDLSWYDDPQEEAGLDPFMGEIICPGETFERAVQNMVGFVRTLGYQGELFVEYDGLDICNIKCDEDKPHVKSYRPRKMAYALGQAGEKA